jgi:hypothetical protein
VKDHHLRGRAPKKTGGFCWGRVACNGSVTYRLFRRDQRGAMHYFIRTYTAAELGRGLNMRLVIATELNRARHALRDQVDTVDLALMGVV